MKIAYDNEVGTASKTSQEIDSRNIGLMYVSDYLYGASPENWNKKPYLGIQTDIDSGLKDRLNNPIITYPEGEIDTDYRSATDDNWLYLGIWEWLITQRQDDVHLAFHVNVTGRVAAYYVGTSSYVVRPSFYLESNAKYKSGTGTFEDPYIISQ